MFWLGIVWGALGPALLALRGHLDLVTVWCRNAEHGHVLGPKSVQPSLGRLLAGPNGVGLPARIQVLAIQRRGSRRSANLGIQVGPGADYMPHKRCSKSCPYLLGWLWALSAATSAPILADLRLQTATQHTPRKKYDLTRTPSI